MSIFSIARLTPYDDLLLSHYEGLNPARHYETLLSRNWNVGIGIFDEHKDIHGFIIADKSGKNSDSMTVTHLITDIVDLENSELAEMYDDMTRTLVNSVMDLLSGQITQVKLTLSEADVRRQLVLRSLGFRCVETIKNYEGDSDGYVFVYDSNNIYKHEETASAD